MYFPTVGGSFISNPGHVSDDRFMRVVNSRARSLPPPTRNPDVFFPTVEDSFVRSPSPVRSLRLDTSEPAQNRPGSVHARDHGVKKKRRENSALLLVPYDKKVSRKQGQRSSATSGHRESCAVGNGTRSQARSELKSAAKISSPISSRTLHSSRVTPQQSKLTRSHATERPVSMPDAAANSTAKKKAAKHRYQFGGVREQERQTKVQAAAQRAQERRMEEQRRCAHPLPQFNVCCKHSSRSCVACVSSFLASFCGTIRDGRVKIWRPKAVGNSFRKASNVLSECRVRGLCVHIGSGCELAPPSFILQGLP